MVLGNGWFKKVGKKNARIILEHPIEEKDYLVWKMSLLPRLFQGKPAVIKKTAPKTKETRTYLKVQSNSSPFLRKLENFLFSPEKRQVSKYLCHPLGLAILYLDNGYCKDKEAYLCLGRAVEDVKEAIESRFNLKSEIEKDSTLRFSPEETKKLINLIDEFVIKEMKYKLL